MPGVPGGVDFIGRAQAVVPDDAELLLAQVLARVVGDGSDARLASILVQLRLGEASGSCTNGVSTALATRVSVDVSLSGNLSLR